MNLIMASRLLKLRNVPAAHLASEPGWRQGTWALYTLSFLGTAVSMGAVAMTSHQVALFAALMVAAARGHLTSYLVKGNRFRPGFVIHPAALLAIWIMHADLLAVFAGGSLLPLAKLLIIVQALASFNLRSLRSLYDALLLSLAVILVASEGALAVHFVAFPATFAVVALAFLAIAHPVSEARRLRWTVPPRFIGLTA